jgi:hypothetical protein
MKKATSQEVAFFIFSSDCHVWTRTPSTNRPPGRFGQPLGGPEGVKKALRLFESVPFLQQPTQHLKTLSPARGSLFYFQFGLSRMDENPDPIHPFHSF